MLESACGVVTRDWIRWKERVNIPKALTFSCYECALEFDCGQSWGGRIEVEERSICVSQGVPDSDHDSPTLIKQMQPDWKTKLDSRSGHDEDANYSAGHMFRILKMSIGSLTPYNTIQRTDEAHQLHKHNIFIIVTQGEKDDSQHKMIVEANFSNSHYELIG
ncbi:hypothetical protein Ancab_024051 [Ancistrocladus abbreviatus]